MMLKRFFGIFALIVSFIYIVPVIAIDEVTDDLNKIAIIGTDGNIFTYDADDDSLTQLTSDADTTRRYQWATWSNDGRLAYFCCENSPQGLAYVSDDGEADPRLVYDNPDTFFIYAYWSPADCGENCRELAMLIQQSSGLAVDVATDSDTPTSETIGTGQPFYYHWDSTGTQMIFHRNNRDLEIYNRAENDVTQNLMTSSGNFQVATWSPVDDRVLIGIEGASTGLSNLVIVNGEQDLTIASDISGLVSFLWSPDGSKIAYRTIDPLGANAITVVDAETGETINIADNSGAVAFFWSPDSSKIAYVSVFDASASASNPDSMLVNQEFIQNDSPTRIAWNIIDIEAQTNVSYSSFVPSFEFIYLLTYFEQFSPSHRVWSPDSRYLVFSGAIENSQTVPMIYTLDTQSTDTPISEIAEGSFGVWSFK